MSLDLVLGTYTGTYSGEVDESGLPDGTGVFTTKNEQVQSWVYDGEWTTGHMKGKGVLSFPDGSRYDAVFWDSTSAIGTYFYTDGSSLSAVMIDGQCYDMDSVSALLSEYGEDITAIPDNKFSTEEKPKKDTDEHSPTLGETNALKKAKRYLEVMSFSYDGLVKQLEYDDYSYDEAVYGVDHCGADWNEQAAKKAATYVDMMAFSRDGLIEQLIFEGFTEKEATYGVEQIGYLEISIQKRPRNAGVTLLIIHAIRMICSYRHEALSQWKVLFMWKCPNSQCLKSTVCLIVWK